MSKDTDRVLGHADEADGIEEYDNPLPDWWVGLFWGTIFWSIAYVAWFALTDQSQVAWYESEVAAADERWPEQAAATIEFTFSEAAAEAGAETYATNCLACHGAALEGGIGPTFLDEEWIHGGQASHVIAVIRNGVLDKGMPAWGTILSPDQINQVASYVLREHARATGRTIEEISAPPAAGEAGAGPGEGPGG
ncbi:MAG: c-type cytochrome [Longimicrobiales bacterium]|nr:c-type cytochrome [Longimicrobiales bacterium]